MSRSSRMIFSASAIFSAKSGSEAVSLIPPGASLA
jgi:hypothetical protein